MNAEQLNSARLARWSQNGEARLTLEAASEWISDIGFCPYLPMDPVGSAPAPSFLEAVVGRPAPEPSAGERARARALLARLIENSVVVPLKLGASLGEQPDFVCSPEVLRYVYALRGDRNFKTGPLTVGNEKVTPLSLHCWQAIEQQGPLDVTALQPILGRDITEAAIVRALQELWAGLYIFPILDADGEAAKWELLVRRFPKPVAAGTSTGHAEALSAMISLSLQVSVAMREEELLMFLSPLAPQSKLREVMRGLGSMRQLDILDIGGRAHVTLQGGLLPEMAAQLSEEQLGTSLPRPEMEGEPEIAMEATPEHEAEVETRHGHEVNFGVDVKAIPHPVSRDRGSRLADGFHEATGSTIKKFIPKKNVPRHADSGRPFRGGSRSGGSGFPRRRGFVPGSLAASADETAGGRPGRSAAFRPGRGRTGPKKFGRDWNPGAAGGRGGRESFSRNREERGPRAPERKGYAAQGRGMRERAKRWEKTGEVPEAPSSNRRPFPSKSSRFKSSGFTPAGRKFRDSKPFGLKSFGSKPAGSKPWQSKSSRAGTHEERSPKPWKKFDGDGDSRGGMRKPYASKSSGFQPRDGKPWAAKSKDGESFSRGPRPSRSGEAGEGTKPWQRERRSYASDRPPGAKRWTSKGAESRIGSAKSYASRSAGKPEGRADGAKPWVRRSGAFATGEEVGSKRRKPKEGHQSTPREKSGAKPFWAKNPRGGKGSSAGSRSPHPRGKKVTRKSGKKK